MAYNLFYEIFQISKYTKSFYLGYDTFLYIRIITSQNNTVIKIGE